LLQDKGDLSAAAAAAMASRSAAAGAGGLGQQAAPSAFQLIGGSSSGRAAAAARAATERQQRQQTLASVPRAIDVLGIVNHQQSQGGLDSQGDDGLAGGQVDGTGRGEHSAHGLFWGGDMVQVHLEPACATCNDYKVDLAQCGNCCMRVNNIILLCDHVADA
jgi:hypothetical protein